MRINTLASSGSYTLRADDVYINEGKTDLGYEPYEVTATELIVNNIGNCISKPIITINGTGTIEFVLNDNNIFRYTFPETETSVVIDSQKQDAYVGTVLKNRNMSGEFPILEVGANTIEWTGTITNIRVISKSRWL
jgi:phage-related protein